MTSSPVEETLPLSAAPAIISSPVDEMLPLSADSRSPRSPQKDAARYPDARVEIFTKDPETMAL